MVQKWQIKEDTDFMGVIYKAISLKYKPAAQAAGADPS